MVRDSDSDSTRRRFLKASAVAGVGGILAGCTGDGGGTTTDSTTESTTAGTTSATDGTTTDSTTTDAGTTTEASASYSVSMEPVGEVEFESTPETWLPYTGDYADMGVALGQADGLAGIGLRARYGSHLYAELPGVSVDESSLTQLWQDGTDKEIFYEVDADVHVVDPNFMVNRLQWNRSDVEEIREQVAPFFGNTTFTQVYPWHDYRYYSMYEVFEKLAAVFRARARYEAFASYHDEVLADVQSRLPSDTPDVAILYPAGLPPESFYPYLVGDGTTGKHWRDLEVGDALAKNDVTDAQAGGATIDYEALLEIDPDAIAVRLQGEITDSYFQENVVAPMADHDLGSQLTAVRNDRVIYGGLTYQGPIIHLFQLEAAAQGLYPDEFGGEQLFDRERVATIVDGDV